MANLGLKKWVRYVPDIGDNREQPEPLELEVCAGLTRAELAAWRDAVAKAKEPLVADAQRLADDMKAERIAVDAAFAELDAATKKSNAAIASVLGQYVRLVGKHTINGKDVGSLAEYAEAISELAGGDATRELLVVVPRLNTMSEEDAVFYERLSGGLASTPRRSAAPKDEKTAGR